MKPTRPRAQSRRDSKRSRRASAGSDAYPPIADYALIGDCHTAALVSRQGSIDWCCLPRFDSDSCFGRLLDWERGGHFSITPAQRCSTRREYLRDGLILVTTFTSGSNQAQLIDFFAMRIGGRQRPRRKLVRIVRGVRGRMTFNVVLAPRLDFGEVKPWIFPAGKRGYVAVGSNTALLTFADIPLRIENDHDLCGELEIRAGHRKHLALQFVRPERAATVRVRSGAIARLEAQFKETRDWWRDWAAKIPFADGPGVRIKRSAIVLKALTYAPTGAIIAAPTTSLPESPGGERNWDYRFCWIRDSTFTVRALSNLGLESEADGVRRFIQRSAAGNADELQVVYAVDGKRRLTEITLDALEGWRGSRPVRIGNAAQSQYQADMYGTIIELSWLWSERGAPPEKHYWEFLTRVVEAAISRWRQPDRGIWEVRSRPRHFVHSKVMCWAAVDGGLALARKYSLPLAASRAALWVRARDQMRNAIESKGYDRRRGIFVRAFGSSEVDAALLVLPIVDFVAHEDPRMLRTTDAICNRLSRRDGLIMRYVGQDGLRGLEGAFLACTFWLAECFARQGRIADARRTFKHASACANELGLFPEQFDSQGARMLGNFPQGLTHLAHVSAAVALAKAMHRSPQTLNRSPPSRSR